MNRRVTIEKRGYGKDTASQAEETWLPVCTTWAGIQSVTGSRQALAEANVPVTSVEVSIRYRTGIVAGMRVRYGDRLMMIDAALDVETKHEELKLLCTEGLDLGM